MKYMLAAVASSIEHAQPPPVRPTESPVHVEATQVMTHERQEPQELLDSNQLLVDTSREFRFVNQLDNRGDQLRAMKQQLDSGAVKGAQRAELQQRYDLENGLYQKDLKNWEAVEAAAVADNTAEGVGKKVKGLAASEQFWREQAIKAENEEYSGDEEVKDAVKGYRNKAQEAGRLRGEIRKQDVVSQKVKQNSIVKAYKGIVAYFVGNGKDPVPGVIDETTLQHSLHRDELAAQDRWSSPYASLSNVELHRQLQEAQKNGDSNYDDLNRQWELRQRGSETIDRLRVSLADQRAAIYDRKTAQDEARARKQQEAKAAAQKPEQTEKADKPAEKKQAPINLDQAAQQVQRLIEAMNRPTDNIQRILDLLQHDDSEADRRPTTRNVQAVLAAILLVIQAMGSMKELQPEAAAA